MSDTPPPTGGEPVTPAKPVAAAPPTRTPRYVWQRRWFQAMLAVLVIFLVLSFVVPGVLRALYAVRSVLVPVLIGLALAYVFNPVVTFAHHKLRLSRLASTISLMLLGLVALAVVAVTALPLLFSQGQSLINTVRETYPRYLDRVLDEIDAHGGNGEIASDAAAAESVTDATADEVPATQPADPVFVELEPVEPAWYTPWLEKAVDSERHRQLLEMLAERLQQLDAASLAQVATQSLDVGVGLVGSAISLTTYLILSAIVIAFCFFFFSWRLNDIKAWFVPFIPAQHRAETLRVLHQMDLAVSAFVRGRLIQSLVMMVVLAIGWWIVDVPYWFLLAVITGAMNLVPFLPMLGWLIALALTVMTKTPEVGFSFGLLLWPTVVYFIAQGLDGWAVEPVVQGKATNLDALTVLLVVLVGGSVAGLLGLLLAIPIAACVKILAREVVLPRLRTLASDG